MMRADALNSDNFPVRMETTTTKNIPTSHVFSMNKRELKEFLVDKPLSHICSTDEEKSKCIIVDECSTKENESGCVHKNINKQKGTNNEAEYEEYSVTDKLPSYFKIFECGKNLLRRIDLTYERVCVFTQKEKYYMTLVETLIDHIDHHNVPLSNKNLRKAVSTVMEETEEE